MSKRKKRPPRRQPTRQPKHRVKHGRSRYTMVGAVAAATIAITVGVFFAMRSTIPTFDGRRALSDIERLVEMGPRVPGTESHASGLAYLQQRLDSLADQTSIQSVSLELPDGDTLFGTNLIASFNLEPSRNVRVMLGAHWDSRPYADRDPDPEKRSKSVPGANDGASGTAVLLEMARIFHENPPEIGVDVLLFDLEDVGVDTTIPFAAGSEQFAAANPHYRPTFGIVVDMVCDVQLRLPREANSQQAARRIVDLVWEAASDEGAEGFLDEVGGAVTDDHLPFLRRGIPVIDIIQSPFPSYWHTTGDTPDKCSAESLEQVGTVLTRVVYTQ